MRLPDGREASWISESGEPAPAILSPVGDRLTAQEALRRARQGEFLLYVGDFQAARQLLNQMEQRLAKAPARSNSPLEAFRLERERRLEEHRTLSRIVIALDRQARLTLRRAPDVQEAMVWAWGEPEKEATVVALKTLLGALGAAEWRRKGVEVPGLRGRIHPYYGVYPPTREDYTALIQGIPDPTGKRVFDLGTGTGVLSMLLLQRGAASAIGTDIDPRAVACARDNAERLGFARRFTALEQPLFPDGRAELIVCNPPWIPEAPKNRIDRAVFDEESAFLRGFVEGLAGHLTPGGRGYLLLSDLAVRLGLRTPGFLPELIARAGLEIESATEAAAQHPRAFEKSDPLHAVRSSEVTTLYCLRRRRED